jgi:hypothetical protein
LGKIGTEVHVVLRAQLKSWTEANAWQQIVIIERAEPRTNLAQAGKRYNPEPQGQGQPVFDLRRNHVAINISTRWISPEFVAGSKYALPKERSVAPGHADVCVIGEDLILSETMVGIEGQAV